MADSKLGVLTARVAVDRGRQPHYGTDEPITGMLVVSYLPYKSIFKKNVTTADYFGPLKLEATLRGKIRVKIKRSRDTVISSDYGTYLFKRSFDVFDGSFKAEVGKEYEFPFAVHFPAMSGECPTPISFRAYFSDYPDRVDAAVVYNLGAKLSTPGIKVETSRADYNPEPEVQLELPRPDKLTLGLPGRTLNQRVMVQNKHLLPEGERPSGMKQNLKAVFSSNAYPKFVANMTCSSIDRVCPGLRPRFSFAIRTIDSETTALVFPNVILTTFAAVLTAHTQVDTSERILASSSCYDSFTAQKLFIWRDDASLPYSLSKTNDHSIEIELEPFGAHPSSFEHPKISRKYVLEIKSSLKIAGTTVAFLKQFPVEILPPPGRSGPVPADMPQSGPSQMSDTIEAGPSRITSMGGLDQPPPAYDTPEPRDGTSSNLEKT